MSNYSMSVSNLAINGKPVQFYRYDEAKMSGVYIKKLAVVLDSWDTKNCSLHSIDYSDTKGKRFKEAGNISASSDGKSLVTMTFSGPEYWPEGYNMTIKYQYYWEDYDEDSGWNSGTTSMSKTITWAERNTVIAE